ncbi:hypothetical protein EKG37_08615 [Robertmurraya yapensis]|uniref:Uncharacterized protein n=3 Tax=Bacillaceae TaxID=186817 RepID=A0A3S0IG47_9BACI|nr:hypothetical protein EKG37_08615 [Bacillus yapensis]TKS96933.1 hypothetical protein FAR12_08615 [Bacillus yapensis]
MTIIFKLPPSFDENEWFILASLFCLIVCFIKIPKIFPLNMRISIFLFYAVIGLTADVIIAADYPVDLYTITDTPYLELFDVIAYVINYPIYGLFFSYIISKWKMSLLSLSFLIVLWSGLTAALEWLSVQFNVFTYHGWDTGHSLIVYLFIFSLSTVVTKLFSYCWRKENLA